MTQGQLPPIRGLQWAPEKALQFINPLPADAAKSELLRFTAERHDGHLQLVGAVWDFVHRRKRRSMASNGMNSQIVLWTL